ncbi:hypothetical protein [Kitasatospora herbaricolor]|uniref:PIN domain-containing protein n=1 Tax=Kitasatospora herbaricolor TaxID=68217 RepID=A0ABZ1W7J2_9ACTN
MRPELRRAFPADPPCPELPDLLVAATAVHNDMTVLHVDRDFATLARVVTELRERDIRDPLT